MNSPLVCDLNSWWSIFVLNQGLAPYGGSCNYTGTPVFDRCLSKLRHLYLYFNQNVPEKLIIHLALIMFTDFNIFHFTLVLQLEPISNFARRKTSLQSEAAMPPLQQIFHQLTP